MKKKNVGLAVLFGAIIPGAGHIYVGKNASGIWYLALYLLILPFILGGWFGYASSTYNAFPPGSLMVIVLVALIVWLFSLYSAYVDAHRFNERMEEESKKCPHCAETIKREAILCRFCQQTV